MPAGAELLVDTSVAVALVVSDHEAHDDAWQAMGAARLGLAGHAAFETFSVLTRLPTPLRRTPWAAHTLIDRNFPDSRFLDAVAAQRLLARLGPMRLGGGAVYDALVGAVAAHYQLPLATRDRRAMDTYQRLDVDVRLLGP
ncbi:MAG: type II toxin-antitoxin system VapC family toxin [Actinomycetota bacterium]|nr:type II toxin-antitoxin system VapC family toxin [Actinomycetota bacterium]